MARTIAEIQAQIIAAKEADPVLAGLTSTSRVAIWRLWTFVVASCQWTLEKLFDQFKLDVDEIIAAMKPHSLRWYAEKVKAFRYGQNLVEETDQYSDEGLTDDEIAESLVIAQCAVVEQENGIRIKVARLVDSELAALSGDQMTSLEDYIKKVKDAGVKTLTTTGPPDELKLDLFIKFNALVLSSTGQRIDGSNNEPVQDAVKTYLKNLPFNGVLELDKLVNEIQEVEGVVAAYVVQATARYGSLPFSSFVDYRYEPDAGYLRIIDEGDLTITFQVA
jgi:hypothetical protein